GTASPFSGVSGSDVSVDTHWTMSVALGDVDGDGDLDLAVGDSKEAGEKAELLYWAENPGSIDQPWTKHLVSNEVEVVDRVEIADFNGDGNLDIAIAEERYPGKEPSSNMRVFLAGNDPVSGVWEHRIIVTQWSMNNLDAVDMDNDGDVDLITNEHMGTEHKTEVYLNDGKANFSARLVGTGHEMHLGAKCFDLDSDGDQEIIGVGWNNYQTLHLYKNEALDREFKWKHLSSVNGDIGIPNGGDQQTAALVADMDNDGINEFFITERTMAPSVVAYKKSGTGWERYIIDETPQRIEAGSTSHDIDGDGDLDIVFGGDGQSNQVWWWENPHPGHNPEKSWKRHLIKDSGKNKHHDQLFGDYDGDGMMELVFWNQSDGKLFLSEIPEKPGKRKGEWERVAIYKFGMDSEMEQTGQAGYPGWKGTNEQEGLDACDIDGDGIDDIVGGGRWFKYDGKGGFTENIIDASYTFTRSVAGQFIEGGRPEVILLAGDGHAPMYLYEYNKKGTWEKTMLIQKVVDGHTIDVLDFNGDGHLDIFSGEMGLGGGNPNAKIRIMLGDGNGNFIHHVVSTGIGTHESKIADLDGDGDYDIVSKPYNWKAPRLDIFINESDK
ncbi:MAG: VCBS repeat-containing protein, partial [Bacteroidales bacterium]|nr:VCBS repeat-containing protein [Bacteroidales bacterium]